MRVAVCIVTHHSSDDLPDCLRSVAALDVDELELCVVDNASDDGSADLAERLAAALELRATVVRRRSNAGFAVGMNQAIAATSGPWILALNADARPSPDFVRRLVARATDCEARGLRIGALTGRLVRPESESPESDGGRLDACGMVLRRTWRHLDRGSGEPDDDRFAQAQLVFGATGAAALYRREALEDVAITVAITGADRASKEPRLVFDPLFHSYREDAELCFRLHERGWSVVYEPAARCEHRRAVVPANRRDTSELINFHSLKNRYLLRAYHESGATLWKTAPFAFARDVAALLWVLLAEHSSLGAYAWLWRHRKDWWRRAKAIRSQRTEPIQRVARWFAAESLPLPPGRRPPSSAPPAG